MAECSVRDIIKMRVGVWLYAVYDIMKMRVGICLNVLYVILLE